MASGTIKAVVPKSDIANNLTTNDSTKVLSAAQGYALSNQIANCPIFYKPTGTETTDSSGQFTIQTGLQLSGKKVFVVSNIPKDSSNQFGVNVQSFESNGNVSFRVRKYSDGTAVGNTTIDLTLIALLIM